jgi:competence protein ComEA
MPRLVHSLLISAFPVMNRPPTVECVFEQSSPESLGSAAYTRLSDLADQARVNVTDGSPAPQVAGRLVERWFPAALTRNPSRRRLIAVCAALVAVIVLVGGSILLLGGSPPAERPPVLPAAGDWPTLVTASADKAVESSLVVSMVGKVASPGLVTVPSGARVADALRAAGGALDGTDISALNLARKLSDGEQLYVGIPVPPQARSDPAAGGGASPSELDLNSATLEQLDALPGIGAVTAKRIIDWRTQHSGFASVEQLQDVDGIGQSKLSRLRGQVSVS